jgi:acyl-CoA synthetase (AMP-forming)/AMP-acid ligase II
MNAPTLAATDDNRIYCQTLVHLLRTRASRSPDQLAYTFLSDHQDSSGSITYRELDRRARSIAALIQSTSDQATRALLLCQPGIDYIVIFFGCLYAGCIPVPAYPPRLKRSFPRIQAIVADAQPGIAFGSEVMAAQFKSMRSTGSDLIDPKWLNVDELPGGGENSWREPSISNGDLAFLQYTSGSTGEPKGVMLSHRNLMQNLAQIAFALERTPLGFEPEPSRLNFSEERADFVSWLPPYHDLGLIGGILTPLYFGRHAVLMSPLAFLRRPLKWLAVMSQFRAGYTAAPSFAYDLCTRDACRESTEALDLGSWRAAIVGAEPVRHDTLERFGKRFAPCGFRSEAFSPGFGLAEATVMVTGEVEQTNPRVMRVREGVLGATVTDAGATHGNSRVVVSCGKPLPGVKVEIVDPHTMRRSKPVSVGEIWISSPSVAIGYWNRPKESTDTFGARIAESEEGPFLRTGDLGFISCGELFVTGRLKELLIVRGVNYYPSDIERTVEIAHPAVRPFGIAAFSVDGENEEWLTVVCEVESAAAGDLPAIFRAIGGAIAAEHGIHVHTISLVRPGVLPRTSSGKLQRLLCRSQFLSGELAMMAEWTAHRHNRKPP